MIKRFAITEAGVVKNIIVIDDTDTTTIAHFGAILIPSGISTDIGWSYDGTTFSPHAPPVLTLDQVKNNKKSVIRAAFEAAANANITVAGVIYQGGYDKAMRLDAARRLAELNVQTTVIFYPLDNVGRTVTMAVAAQIVTAISLAYQTEFARKQARMVAIDAALNTADVEVVTW